MNAAVDRYFDSACAQRLFDALQQHWRDTIDYRGIYRPGYSQQENAAIAMMIDEAARIGMQCYADLAGNVYMRFAGADASAKALVTGSHLDCVPQGGAYDGTACVVGALAMCSAFAQHGIVPRQDIVVMIIRAEESPWFAQASIGSKLALGQFPAEKFGTLTHREDGQTLAQHMEMCGVDVRKLTSSPCLFPVDETAAFIELHIEQAPLLYTNDIPVGIVSSNRGSMRIARVQVQGEGGHTGAVPMELRRDAVRAAARYITRFEDACQALIEQGHDIVFTVPVIDSGRDASPTTIPKTCSFYLEARSSSPDTQALLLELVGRLQREIEAQYRVNITMDAPTISKPALFDAALQQVLTSAAEKLGIAHQPIAGGAGHDAAIFANSGVRAGMLFIRHEGHSHRHDEAMALDDLAASVAVLAECCLHGITVQRCASGDFIASLLLRGAETIMTQEYAAASHHG